MQSRQAVRQAVRANPGARIVVTGCYAQTAAEDLKKIKGVDYVIGHAEKHKIADRFSAATIVKEIQPVSVCTDIRQERELNRVVLSGGCFQNATLLSGMIRELQRRRFEVFAHEQVPTNDGGISLGQAVVAAAQMG